jgi:hypothetical protein
MKKVMTYPVYTIAAPAMGDAGMGYAPDYSKGAGSLTIFMTKL